MPDALTTAARKLPTKSAKKVLAADLSATFKAAPALLQDVTLIAKP